MTQATFGLFDWIDRGNTPLQQLYEERLQLLEAADAAGFFAYHLAEHHATPLGHGVLAGAVPRRGRAAHRGASAWGRSSTSCRSTTRCGSSRRSACSTTSRAGGSSWASVAASRPTSSATSGSTTPSTRAHLRRGAGGPPRRADPRAADVRGPALPVPRRPDGAAAPPAAVPAAVVPDADPGERRVSARHGYHFVGLGPAALARQPVADYWQTWQRAPARPRPAQRPCGRAQGGHRPPGRRRRHRRGGAAATRTAAYATGTARSRSSGTTTTTTAPTPLRLGDGHPARDHPLRLAGARARADRRGCSR